jgi:hypothetical protein
MQCFLSAGLFRSILEPSTLPTFQWVSYLWHQLCKG